MQAKAMRYSIMGLRLDGTKFVSRTLCPYEYVCNVETHTHTYVTPFSHKGRRSFSEIKDEELASNSMKFLSMVAIQVALQNAH